MTARSGRTPPTRRGPGQARSRWRRAERGRLPSAAPPQPGRAARDRGAAPAAAARRSGPHRVRTSRAPRPPGCAATLRAAPPACSSHSRRHPRAPRSGRVSEPGPRRGSWCRSRLGAILVVRLAARLVSTRLVVDSGGLVDRGRDRDGSRRPSGTNSSGPSSASGGGSPCSAAIRPARRIERQAKRPAKKAMSPPPHNAIGPREARTSPADLDGLVGEERTGDPVVEVGEQRRDGQREQQAQADHRVERGERAPAHLVAHVLLDHGEAGDVRRPGAGADARR